MTNRHTISIIIPVYNSAEYLPACLNSVLTQTSANYDVIIVDDGSTDGSSEICENFAQKNEQVRVIHTQNKGVSSARNEGIRNLNTEYFIFVDSDDMIRCDTIEVLENCIFSHANADLLLFGYEFVEGTQTHTAVPPEGVLPIKQFAQDYLALLCNYMINTPTNKVFRRTINAGGLFDNAVTVGEDLLFCNEYIKKCRTIYLIDIPLYIHMQRSSNSLTTTLHADVFGMYEKQYYSIQSILESFGIAMSNQEQIMIATRFQQYIKESVTCIMNPAWDLCMADRYAMIKDALQTEFVTNCLNIAPITSLFDFFVFRKKPLFCMLYVLGAQVKKNLKEFLNIK